MSLSNLAIMSSESSNMASASGIASEMPSQSKTQFIYEGSDGCVYSFGGFPCKDPNLNKGHENDVMKIQKKSSYREHIAKIILQIDPRQEHLIIENSSCNIATFDPTLKNSNGDLCKKYQYYTSTIDGIFRDGKNVDLTGYFMKNGGDDLITFCDKNAKDPSLIGILLSSMCDILKAVRLLKVNRILHLDIKPDNITFDGKKSYLIDFGMALTYDELREKLLSPKPYYFRELLPPFLNVIGENMNYNAKAKHTGEHFINELVEMKHFGLGNYLLNNQHYILLYHEQAVNKAEYIKKVISLFDKIDSFSVGFAYVGIFRDLNIYNKLTIPTREFLQSMIHSNPEQQLDLDTAISKLEKIILNE